MFDKADLDELHQLLNRANVTDDYIRRGVRLTGAGTEKVAVRFGINPNDVPQMLSALSAQMAHLKEDAPRFTHEADYMGNITLRDSKSGKSRFFQGDEAFRINDELSANPDKEQDIISPYFDEEVLEESIDEEPTDDLTDKGTFNFPYRGKFATAVYGLDSAHKFILKVISLRDQEDTEVEITPELQAELDRVALTWVDKV